ncbi:MAG: hypothetical protein IJ069_12655 [Prevotella sp.]|nr:hypothetical protein [Prevotella sp.]MBQ8154499.1 hypothetical protein [Prevotella sp.]
MDDIAKELAKLHVLTGADFSRQVERIAKMNIFYPLADEKNIYITGGEQQNDFENLLNAARKAVDFGYQVFILPNPKECVLQISSLDIGMYINSMTSKQFKVNLL